MFRLVLHMFSPFNTPWSTEDVNAPVLEYKICWKHSQQLWYSASFPYFLTPSSHLSSGDEAPLGGVKSSCDCHPEVLPVICKYDLLFFLGNWIRPSWRKAFFLFAIHSTSGILSRYKSTSKIVTVSDSLSQVQFFSCLSIHALS